MGDSCDLRDKYVEITAHLLLGDAGKLSVNFLIALDFSILLRKHLSYKEERVHVHFFHEKF